MNVNGYYGTPAVPQQQNAGTPAPTVVNVNNVGTSSPSFNLDQYKPQMAQIEALAAQAAPYAPAAAAGFKANSALAPAKAKFTTAARSSRAATKAKNASAGRSLAMGSILNTVKNSVIFNGIISLAVNGYKVFKKEITLADAGANVSGDVSSAVVGGAAAGVATAAGTAILGSMGLAGLGLSAATLVLGIGGYMVADSLFRKTSIFQSITNGARNLLQGAA